MKSTMTQAMDVGHTTARGVMLLCSLMLLPMPLAFAQPAPVSPISVRVTISLMRQSDVAARDAGALADVRVKRGDHVKAGSVLATLENGRQVLAVNAAELNLKIAELNASDSFPEAVAAAQLREATSGRDKQQVALQIARTESASDVGVRLAAAVHRLAELEFQRAKNAREAFEGAVSKSEMDRLQASVSKSKLELEAAQRDQAVLQLKPEMEQAALQQLHESLGRFQTLVQQEQRNLRVAELTRDARQNEAEIARLQMEYRTIRAPFDGVITDVRRQTGDWVEAGMPVIRLVELKTLSAEGFVSLRQSGLGLLGQPVRIVLNAGSEELELSGHVTFVSPEIDPVNQQVRVSAEFHNKDQNVQPGMQGTMQIGVSASPRSRQ